MNRLTVDTQILGRHANTVAGCSGALSAIMPKIQSAMAGMPECCVSSGYARALSDQQDSARALLQSTQKLEDAFKKSITVFDECEENVTSMIAKAGDDDNNKSVSLIIALPAAMLVTGLAALLIRIIAWHIEWSKMPQEWKEQRQRDELLAEQMEDDIFKKKEHNKKAWEKASLEERRKMIEEIIDEINQIQGTDVSTDLNSFYEPPDETGITNGAYSHDLRQVSINDYIIENNSYDSVMTTVVHEMRHAYQHEVVDNPENFVVSESFADSWAENFAPGNYIDPDVDFPGYESQPVERDARSFADLVDYS